MRVPRFFGLIVFAIAVLASATRAEADDAAERVFYNARIFTAETEHPYAEAVAIRGDKIVAVGSRADVEKKVGKQAERIDLLDQLIADFLWQGNIHQVVAMHVADFSSSQVVLCTSEAMRLGSDARPSLQSRIDSFSRSKDKHPFHPWGLA